MIVSADSRPCWTAGQHDAGLLAGGDYTVEGGFWIRRVGDLVALYSGYLPLE